MCVQRTLGSVVECLTQWMGTSAWVSLTLALAIVLLYKRQMDRRLKIPGPFPWPLIGNALSMGPNAHLNLLEMRKRYGPVFLMKLGSVDVVVLNDHRSIHEALVLNRRSLSGRPHFPSFANISGGDGIVFNDPTTQGERWRRSKQFLLRNLNRLVRDPESRRTLVRNIRRESAALVARLADLHDHHEGAVAARDVSQSLHLSVANIACACVFGRRYDYDDRDFQQLISMNGEFGEFVGANNQTDTMPILKLVGFLTSYFDDKLKKFKSLNHRMTSWVKARSEERGAVEGAGSRDLWEKLTRSGEGEGWQTTAILTDVFGATQDTTSALIKWTILYLVRFPHYQDEIRAEIESQLEEEEEDDLGRLVALRSFVHEVARHTSLVAMTIPHACLDDVTVAGYRVGRGTVVFANQHAANHDPADWPDPDRFRPARFRDATSGGLDQKRVERLMLFGLGARKCPGNELAMTIVLHLLTTLLSTCHFASPETTPPSLAALYNLTMQPEPYRLRVRLHDRARLERIAHANREWT